MARMLLGFFAALLLRAHSHPAGLECGTDATTRLRVGQTIMTSTVVNAPASSLVKVELSRCGSEVTVTAPVGTYFAAKAFGQGATVYPRDSGLNLTKNCSNQVYTAAGNSTTYTFRQHRADSIVVGYASAPGVVSLVTAEVPREEHPRDYTDYDFNSFLSEFKKSYGVEEQVARKALFEAKLAEVVAHNMEYEAGKHTWYKAVNHLSDWTEAEFQSMKAGKAHHVPSQHPVAQLKATTNPDRIDWRESGKVTPVKNQGGCGSCWAFSATEVVESHHAIATGSLLTLAPQTFVNCVKNPQSCGGTGGCEGATMELAFNLTVATGMALESDLPYRGRDETCTSYRAAVKATGYVKVPENNAEALETAIATKGPVSVTVAANWGAYGGGIFSGGCTSRSCTLDHGVVAVGYDKTAGGEGYWLVRNSWGSSWGENGYIRLSRKNDAVTFTDNNPADGVACKPYPKSQTVKGESGILFDTSYPTGVSAADTTVVV